MTSENPLPAAGRGTWHAIGGGAYEERIGGSSGKPTGRYRARPFIAGRPTWRKLESRSRAKAIKESSRADWIPKADKFSELMRQWVDAGCPGRKKKPPINSAHDIPWVLRHFSRSKIQLQRPSLHPTLRQIDISLPWLLKYFGNLKSDEIRHKHLANYADWRRRSIKRGEGGRTIDLDCATLSNIHHYGVKQGILELNYIYHARDRHQRATRHAREVMPASAEIIHQIAGEFFTTVRSEVMAWMTFFTEFTGCRTSELLRLDLNAANKNQAGFIEWLSTAEIKDRGDDIVGHLYLGRRSKNGLNPWAKIGPEFSEMIRAFLHWHRKRFGLGDRSNPRWFFPGRTETEVIEKCSFGHALTRIRQELSLPHITPHGFRAFYATKRLRDGARTVEIAAEMGDKTVALVETIYADNADGKKLWWVPADGLPAWQNWIPDSRSQVNSQVHHAQQKPVTTKKTRFT